MSACTSRQCSYRYSTSRIQKNSRLRSRCDWPDCSKREIVRPGRKAYIPRMRRIFIFLLLAIGSGSTPALASQLSLQILSERTVLVAPTLAPELISYLDDTQNALICIAGGSGHTGDADRGPIVWLPDMPTDSVAARDSIASWRDQFGIKVVFAPSNDDAGAWSAAARVSAMAYYRQVAEFQPGDFALPVSAGYQIFRGPAMPMFKERVSRLQRLQLADATHSATRGSALLARAGEAIDLAFRNSDTPDPTATDALLNAAATADSIGRTTDSAATLAGLYGRRWRHFLGWLLTPEIDNSTLELFSGIAQSASIVFKSRAAVPVDIVDLTLEPSTAAAEWEVPFPVTMPPNGLATLPVRLTAGPAGDGPISLHCRFEYGGFVFDRALRLSAPVMEPLELRFDPPILFASGTGNLTGRLVVRNRSKAALDFDLTWSAENPLSVTTTGRKVSLAADEAQNLTYTISIPSRLAAGAFGLEARAANAGGLHQSAIGSVWSGAAPIDRTLKVGVVGGRGPWMEALSALGIGASPLVASAIGQADFAGLHAIVIPEGVDAPDAAAPAVLADFVQSGHIVLFEMTPDVARWLPWETRLISRPGPYAARFFDETLSWWEVPNVLVGGCFAAAGSRPVYTLAAGSTGWEPLLVDEAGKGYMYRRAEGNGWYVGVHIGWAPRFERLDRRALLGLITLVGTKRS